MDGAGWGSWHHSGRDRGLTLERVLHIGKYYHPHAGGMEAHLRTLATRQRSRFEVEVIVANESPRSERTIIDGVAVTRVANLGVVASQPLCPSLVRAIRDCDADIVHLHVPNPAAGAAYLLSGHQGKLIVTHHSDILGRSRLRRILSPIMRRVMERATRIIVTSRRYAETSRELRPYLKKCVSIPLAFDPRALGPVDPEEVRRIRGRLGGPLLLAVGRLVPYKGFEYLVRAMRSVAASLMIVGTGPLRDRLSELISRSGLRHRVHLYEDAANLHPFYDAADIVVVPSISRAEAFGLVQLEAMACGKPVINTDLDSGVPEVSLHGKTGLTVRPADAEALAAAIQTLLDDPSLRRDLGIAAKARASRDFSVDTMVRSTIEVYGLPSTEDFQQQHDNHNV